LQSLWNQLNNIERLPESDQSIRHLSLHAEELTGYLVTVGSCDDDDDDDGNDDDDDNGQMMSGHTVRGSDDERTYCQRI
jgi:hypothetical protein